MLATNNSLDGLLQQLGFLQEWCDALNRRLDAYLSMRQDAEFEESEHPRDQDGKFAKTAEGAKAGMEFHAGEAEKYRQSGNKELVRPHNRAQGHYKTAMEHYLGGRQAEGEEAHKAGQKHGMEGIRRVKKHEGGGVEPVDKGGDKKPDPEPEPVPDPEPEPTPTPRPSPVVKPAGQRMSKAEFSEHVDKASAKGIAYAASQHQTITGGRDGYGPEKLREGFKRAAAFHHKSWEHATPDMQRIVANMRPVTCVYDANAKGAHYKNGTDIINMPKNYDDDQVIGTAIWRHEYGHAIDYEDGRHMPKSYDAAHHMDEDYAALDKSLARVKKELSKQFGPGKTAAKMMSGELYREAIARAVREVGPETATTVNDYHNKWLMNDFLGSMTINKIGSGHSDDYYTSHGRQYQTTEMFANYVSLCNAKDGHHLKAIMHHLAPNVCKAFDMILEESGKNE